ncbi:unnamed protein product [Bursaphelenchus xylophilus]|uniref:(pine wood nematode) hypothetical protein n=1 Tax=Bursaphelenchus xylophilus TaxID=6326 RepID=A0A1I7RM05_BURXY|nr:unnamed protein product [Bursaphelenchus xylophilus]CAG9118076.1 unnamed protein product [Bursaphelenchus xylophilus]
MMTFGPEVSRPSEKFYHPRRSSNSLNVEIEYVMRLMAQSNSQMSNSSSQSFGGFNKSMRSGCVPTDQCLYIQIPNENGGLF